MPEWGLFENILENNKDNLCNCALSYWGNRISYAELLDGIVTARDILKSIGVTEGSIVSYISVITPELIYLFYACNMLGAISNMIDPRLTAMEKSEKITKTDSKILVVLDACDAGMEDVLKSSECVQKVIFLLVKDSMGPAVHAGYSFISLFTSHRWAKRYADKVLYWHSIYHKRTYAGEHSEVGNPHDAAAIFYTGGTTGEAKGVCLSTYSINAVAEQYRGLTGGFQRGEKWLTLSVPFVAYAVICSMHIPLSSGLNCVIELYDIPRLVKSVLKNKIKYISATPLFYVSLNNKLQSKRQDMSFLTMPISGGDKLNKALYEKTNDTLLDNGCKWKVCSGYGMTEVSSAASVSFTGNSNKPGSSGIPFPQTIISAFDPENDEECKIGQCGEIRISGPGVMIGYYNNPQKTKEIKWTDANGRDWICTGDYGYIDEDGCVFVIERIKRLLIKYDGFKVFPAHVEEAAMHSNYVEECCCVGIFDKDNQCGDIPVLFVKLKEMINQEESLKDIWDCCRRELAQYSIPHEIRIIDSMPLTHAGKVDYRELERLANAII